MNRVHPEYWILASYWPTEYKSEVIEAEIRDILREFSPCCAREAISVRIPHERAPDPHPDNLQWHQDGGGKDGTTRHMVVWASEMPTEIRLSDGTVFQAEPHDVVWFDNDVVTHRQPTGTNEKTRWFVSVRCSGR